jgi:galactose-1-phosphate uridylyltransferase
MSRDSTPQYRLESLQIIAESIMTAAYATLALDDTNASTDTEIEEFHAITRLVVFAKESAALLDAHQTVYCLDLALEQIARELRHRADSSSDIVPYFSRP